MKNRIRDYRKEKGYTQQDLAEQLKVSRQTINAIENNKYYPSLELGLQLAYIFGCKVDDLFSLE